MRPPTGYWSSRPAAADRSAPSSAGVPRRLDNQLPVLAGREVVVGHERVDAVESEVRLQRVGDALVFGQVSDEQPESTLVPRFLGGSGVAAQVLVERDELCIRLVP